MNRMNPYPLPYDYTPGQIGWLSPILKNDRITDAGEKGDESRRIQPPGKGDLKAPKRDRRRFHGGRVLPRLRASDGDVHLLWPGLGQPADRARQLLSQFRPFLAVTGNVPTSQFNRGAFQELYRHYQADFPSTVRAYCKRVFQPTRGDMVPLAIRQAWKTMVTGSPTWRKGCCRQTSIRKWQRVVLPPRQCRWRCGCRRNWELAHQWSGESRAGRW